MSRLFAKLVHDWTEHVNDAKARKTSHVHSPLAVTHHGDRKEQSLKYSIREPERTQADAHQIGRHPKATVREGRGVKYRLNGHEYWKRMSVHDATECIEMDRPSPRNAETL